MLISLLEKVDKIYIAYGATDFRKEINSLCNIVKNIYGKNPYDNSAYIFCNKKRTSIKILSYDKNGFILAQKTLVQANKMKFQWCVLRVFLIETHNCIDDGRGSTENVI